MDTASYIAIFASVFNAFIGVPQLISTWRYRHDPAAVQAVSLGRPVLVLFIEVLWLLWAYYSESTAAWLSLLGLPLIVATELLLIQLLLRCRRGSSAVVGALEAAESTPSGLLCASCGGLAAAEATQ